MVATETMTPPHMPALSERTQAKSREIQNSLVTGLGWFSLGLGLAEVVTPGSVSRLIGIRNDETSRNVLRGFGMRELAAGVGILTQQRPAGWVWSRVAGDVLDMASLLSARKTNPARVAVFTAAVAGITALDIMCSRELTAAQPARERERETRVTRTIGVDRSPEEAYQLWRNFENLPKFMTYLESVQSRGDNRSRWVAKGPAGITAEWDAEILRDEPNRFISWRSVKDATLDIAGQVRFDRAPGGRGTIVRVDMDFAPDGGALKSLAGKILGPDLRQRIMHDLRNFKQVLELGEVTQSDASIHPGMHPAQPEGVQPDTAQRA